MCRRIFIALLVPLFSAVALASDPVKIYVGGTILTMDESQPRVEAVAVRGKNIIALGDQDEVIKSVGEAYESVDLQGRTLLPGFIDSHSHLSLVAQKLSVANASPPPNGPVDSLAKLKTLLLQQRDLLTPGQWLVGWGYDHDKLQEQRHPTRQDLDRISTEYPIALIHFSAHQAVLNSRALALMGYNAESEDPVGGVIRCQPGSRQPNGLVEEQAWMPVYQRLFNPSPEKQKMLLEKAAAHYASRGFTTVQDGATFNPQVVRSLKQLGAEQKLPVDVVLYPYAPFTKPFSSELEGERDYKNGIRFGGVKLVLDGGTPGRTAFLRQPYHTQLPGERRYRGYPHQSQQSQIDAEVSRFYGLGIPLNIHALGDAAVDQAIAAVSAAEAEYPGGDRRTNLIHLQLVNDDQFDQLQKLDVTLTFQVNHNYDFGDFHRQVTLGPERAARLNPARTSIDRGFNTTIHHDAPVHAVDQLALISAAVNRTTRSGKLLGAAQKITVMEALKASTINAAHQYFEESSKGSIQVGKLADFVILSANPIRVRAEELADIEVLETIKAGRSVYRKTP